MTSNLLWQPTAIKLLPLDERTDRRLQQARLLCQRAINKPSWAIANRLAHAWLDCGCDALGCPAPADDQQPVVRRRQC